MADAKIRAIRSFLKEYPMKSERDIYESLPVQRKSLVTPLTLTDEEYTRKWQAEKYEHKPIPISHLCPENPSKTCIFSHFYIE